MKMPTTVFNMEQAHLFVVLLTSESYIFKEIKVKLENLQNESSKQFPFNSTSRRNRKSSGPRIFNLLVFLISSQITVWLRL